ncbi:MAG: hypothetical protein ABIR47_09135 [Candidatus Kapaibacterium sp.]
MEIAHGRISVPQWERPEESFNHSSIIEANPSFDYLENFSRGYNTGRHDGTIAGLLIGSVSGAIMALLVCLLF